jgi:hypothetical protein
VRTRRRFPRVATAAAVAMTFVALGASAAQAFTDPYDTPLTLVNGWTSAPYGTQTAGVKQLNDGIVTFTGAISAPTGSNPIAFTLPANDRPATNVYVPVDMCSATKGRLFIQPSGVVTVQSEGAFTNATCFTSLDGATFALPTSNTALTPQNGWQGAPYGTGTPGVQLEAYQWGFNGPTQTSVHFTGAISGGSTTVAFNLPPAFRPSTTRYVPVDMCGATNGRIIVEPNGNVSVQAESSFANAQCFTSLDGAWFTLNPSPVVAPLALQNGWTAYGFGTAAPTYDQVSASTVIFTGAISAPTGSNPVAFTLPSGLAPSRAVYVSIDLCSATKGRLYIQPNGVVTVQSEGAFTNATCFTSLDGVSYSLWLNPPA